MGPKPVPPDRAVQEMRDAGYEPLTPYAGITSAPWPSRCLTCGKDRTPALATVRQGRRCLHTGTPRPAPLTPPEKAERELREAGYEPLAPYPGTVRMPWPARCTGCGQERSPSLNTIRTGKVCRHREASRPTVQGMS